jgi:nucleoside-diphosphate-sugar epimerase
MRIALLGATGYVGNEFVRHAGRYFPDVELIASGRNQTKLASLQRYPNVRAAHSYEHGEGLHALLQDADVCVDLSYQTHGVPSQQIRRSREHAERLVTGCHEHGVQHLVIVGSVAVYGVPVIKHPWREAPPPDRLGAPTTIYSRVKGVVESHAGKVARQYGVKVAFIRSGHIMGAASKMAANIAATLLRADVSLLAQRKGPSNATTVEGLVATLLDLATNPWQDPSITANHVNLAQVSYDDIVRCFARHMGIEPVAGRGDVSRRRLRSRVLQSVRENEGWLSVIQSYASWSEGIVSGIKRAYGKEKAAIAGVTGTGLPSGKGILPIYLSDAVPHTSPTCGPLIEASHLEAAIEPTRKWLTNSGFDGFQR